MWLRDLGENFSSAPPSEMGFAVGYTDQKMRKAFG